MRQRKVVRKNVLSQERCEALLVSHPTTRSQRQRPKPDRPTQPTIRLWFRLGRPVSRLHPNKGMHLLVTAAIPPFLRMHRNHETVCDDYHSRPLKRYSKAPVAIKRSARWQARRVCGAEASQSAPVRKAGGRGAAPAKGDTRCLFRSTLWAAGFEHNLAAELGDATRQAIVRLALGCSLS